jgi:diguanylate cyclase (GGDEF)-like protein
MPGLTEVDVDLTLLLPWFPIILAVALSGRMLGRPRGLALGFLCALFWVVLTLASRGAALGTEPLQVASLLTGAAAIVAVGAWAGNLSSPEAGRRQAEGGLDAAISSTGRQATDAPRAEVSDRSAFGSLSDAFVQFDDWLEVHRDDPDPWPKFDEFIRGMMYQTCRATHVRPYRVLSDHEDLIPLRESEITTDARRVSARRGIIGHIVTTGRSYVAGDASQGDLICHLAEESGDSFAWCFAVSHGPRRIGLVTVGELGIVPETNKALLRVVEDMVCLFWSMLCETCRSRAAETDDPVSGLLTLEAFLRVGGQTVTEAYGQREPVALAVIALEQLRHLNDTGRWATADELVREACALMRQKVRSDDTLGRFDGSRFLILLRRVDSELARLIMDQLVARLAELCGDSARWRAAVSVRCGVVGSGTERPELLALISQAVGLCHRARREDTPILSDLGAPLEGSTAGAEGAEPGETPKAEERQA